MPAEIKQRKKTKSQKQTDEITQNSPANGKDEAQKAKTEDGENRGANKTPSGPDIKLLMCLFSLLACGVLSWVVLRQTERFSLMEEKFRVLHGKTSSLLDMEEEIVKVSKKCETVQQMLEGLGPQQEHPHPRLQALEEDIVRLKDWTSGLSEKRVQLHSSLTSLRDAVGRIEDRTSAITKDFANKVSSVRTDMRRMDGLRSDLDSVLTQVGELEDKTNQVERSMVKRIGDVLASSIDRVSNLRSASERNAKAIDQLRKRIPELTSIDEQISERLRELESGRARLIRTVTFAADLKPKVASIKRDFGAFEPQVSDLTLRIGRLAADLSERELEIVELRQTLLNLTAVEGDLSVTTEQVQEIADISDTGEIQNLR
ncbi:inhibitor of nuclear factor kappa-B kinase-interacting protein isoform X2 [Girardinichthys multiradiatus]|uniref:inhibitor of nuclear factor kappa-B kinase-interacting protein isoform X2 n=1 Tax=Girardinichthys multiradiatus TaxID=208333 RepID=UPI001FAB413A|nr:inhibitor of nuclear factor kappa-B kinase-interacting protein isoform X2 [Girardinichthys multiradiatus]